MCAVTKKKLNIDVKALAAPLLCFLFPTLSVGKRKHKRGAAGTFTGTLPLCSRPSGSYSVIKS